MTTPYQNLDEFCAVKKAPIRLGGQSLFQPKLLELEQERKNFLDSRWGQEAAPAKHQELMQGLKSFAGTHALIPVLEEDIENLLQRGQLWGPTSKTMKGQPSQCHSNSCLLFEANQERDLFVATGYALSDDGLWRQHSWCVNKRPRSVQIIETTEPRELYFGFVLNLKETIDFASHNTDFGIEVMESTRQRFEALGDPTAALKKGLRP